MNKKMIPGQLTRAELDAVSRNGVFSLEAEALYVADVCRDELDDGSYRASGVVRVAAAAARAAAGLPVPVSGDAHPRWLMARHR